MTIFSPQFKLTLGVLILLALAWTLHALAPILIPFIAAWMLAYALGPARRKVAHWLGPHIPKVVSAVVIELIFLSLLVALLGLVTPIVVEELPQLRDQLPLMFERMQVWMRPFLEAMGVHLQLDAQSIKNWVTNYVDASWNDVIAQTLASLRLGGSIALTVLGNMVLIPLLLFYFLMDQDDMVHRLGEWVPPRYKAELMAFFADVDHLLGQYLRGQLGVMLTMACYYSAALALVGLKLALPIGLLTGLMLFIPYIGIGTGFVLALMSALIQFEPSYAVLGVGLVYAMGQGMEGFFLTPRLVGERIGLHPVMVIFALLFAAQAVGLVGVMIALPVSAVLSVAVRWLKKYYLKSAFFGHDHCA